MKKVALLLCTVLMVGSAYAGGSLFKHKSKTANTNGVYSIGVHICGSLECSPIRIVQGQCTGEHMTQQWGVCVCDKGYVAQGSGCKTCPDGQYSDGIHECQSCPEGSYVKPGETSCHDCPDSHALSCDSSGKTTACEEGYYIKDGECIEEGKCPDGSKMGIYQYWTGECCTTMHTLWNYCPGDEVPPACEPEAYCTNDEGSCM